VKRDGVHVVPAPVHPEEAAGFVVDAAPAVLTEVRLEFHNAFGVERAAPLDGHDVQPPPLQARVELQLRGPFAGVPCFQEVAGIQQDEGRVAGTHQLLGGGCLRRTAVEPATAVRVLLAGKARAVTGKGFWLGHGIFREGGGSLLNQTIGSLMRPGPITALKQQLPALVMRACRQ
jgi:hypothetical protein